MYATKHKKQESKHKFDAIKHKKNRESKFDAKTIKKQESKHNFDAKSIFFLLEKSCLRTFGEKNSFDVTIQGIFFAYSAKVTVFAGAA